MTLSGFLDKIRWLIATGGGTGLMPVAPATWASLAAVLLYAVLPIDGGHPVFITMVFGGFLLAVWAAHRSLTPTSHDPKFVVSDEFIGMWAALLWIPKEWAFLVAAFLLFRLFDITKPFYIRRFERLPGGLGVVADDVMAGVLTNLVLQLFARVLT
ncbi:MAG: phosphatidylglycerophosphatase A [Chloroflexi bacterium]|jgi:phosphatidylglycerophosphatase A|nr:MAG: phosphatidylglycerophosphatase A [Chloroflexota bacterium]